MSQFTIYENKNQFTRGAYPYLIDIQSPLFEPLATRLVIPMAAKSQFLDKPIQNLNPIVNINGVEYLVLTQQIAAIKMESLGRALGECKNERHAIVGAIDFLVTGF